ncbi:hypothetical protein P7C70_g6089, partial [Phenoliferia sp. Uapishka_3]
MEEVEEDFQSHHDRVVHLLDNATAISERYPPERAITDLTNQIEWLSSTQDSAQFLIAWLKLCLATARTRVYEYDDAKTAVLDVLRGLREGSPPEDEATKLFDMIVKKAIDLSGYCQEMIDYREKYGIEELLAHERARSPPIDWGEKPERQIDSDDSYASDSEAESNGSELATAEDTTEAEAHTF